MMRRSDKTPPSASDEEVDSEDGSWYNENEEDKSIVTTETECQEEEEEEVLEQGAEDEGEAPLGDSPTLLAKPEEAPSEQPEVATT